MIPADLLNGRHGGAEFSQTPSMLHTISQQQQATILPMSFASCIHPAILDEGTQNDFDASTGAVVDPASEINMIPRLRSMIHNCTVVRYCMHSYPVREILPISFPLNELIYICMNI